MSQIIYCSNLLSCNSPEELSKKVLNCPGPFDWGLGVFSEFLPRFEVIANLCRELENKGQPVATINAFPYSNFYTDGLKENVYLPDWNDKKRLDYTKVVLEKMSPLPFSSSIVPVSTVPLGIKDGGRDHIKHLNDLFNYCSTIEKKWKKRFIIAFEPEPRCLIENIDQSINFYENLKRNISEELVNRYFSFCIDLCHMAVNYIPEEKVVSFINSSIPVSKIQVSNAPVINSQFENIYKLIDPIYLHQFSVFLEDDSFQYYLDIEKKEYKFNKWKECRVHYHIPIYLEFFEGMKTTQSYLKSILSKVNREVPLEIETYTFEVNNLEENKTPHQNILEEISWLQESLRL